MKSFKTSLITVLIAVAVILMPLFFGCQQTLTPQQIQAAAVEVNDLNTQLDAYQAAAIQTAQGIKDANLIDANTLAKIQQLNSEADKVRAKIKILTAALANVQVTGDNNQDLINLLQQLNAASAPFNPYAAPTAGILAIISLILTAIAKQKATEATTNKKALTEVIKGGQWFKEKAAPEAVALFRASQDSEQSAETKQLVGMIKATA